MRHTVTQGFVSFPRALGSQVAQAIEAPPDIAARVVQGRAIESAGIPVEDHLVNAGGRYKHSVVHAGWSLDNRSVVTTHLSHAPSTTTPFASGHSRCQLCSP